jgi:hypothetical protein
VRLLLVVLGVFVFAATAAAPALADNHFDYSGTLDGSTTADGTGDTTSVHVNWREIGSSPTLSASTVTWSLATLSGTVTFSGDASTATPACSGTLSASPNPNKVYAPGIVPVMGGYEVLTYSPARAGSSGSPMDYQVQSTAAPDSTCGTPYYLVAAIEGCARNNVGATSFDAALRPDTVFPGGSSVKQFNVPSIPGTHANCSTQFSFSLSSSIQFTGDPVSGTPTPTPPPTPTPVPPTTDEEKSFAAFDFLSLFPLAAVECDDTQQLAAAFGNLNVIPVLRADCDADVSRLVDDFFIFLDPPDKRIGVVAVPIKVSATGVRLPTCPRRGHAAAGCRRLRAELGSYVTAARQITSIDDALHTTFDRLSSARQAGNAAAIALQTRAASNLSGQLHRAIAARAKLGRTIATRLATSGRRVRLTRAQDANAITQLVRRLEKAGLPQTRLRAVAGKALTPRPFDLSSLL